MIPSQRWKFNASFSSDKYARFLALLGEQCGEPAQFRHSETPCFVPAELIGRMAQYGVEIVEQLMADESYRAHSVAAIPAMYRVPNEDPMPLFVQADFGLDQNLQPKLVEIQGFPSLYAYQTLLPAAYRQAYGLDDELEDLPGHLTLRDYTTMLREAIVASEDPDTVILMDIDPRRQKTRHDFVLTEKLFGVHAVDIRDLRKRGNRLYYNRNGRETPVRRIYNRTIADELERRGIESPFDWREPLDVHWAGHPNWYFQLSKYSLPYLRHPAVPKTEFLNRAGRIERPEQYVLKPLYSFAGVGVIVGPTYEQLDAVAPAQRANYILQQRVDFRPVIDTPFGMTKVELRIMYICRHGTLQAVNTIVRMGRGAQMGVDHNKGYEWVGASAALIAPEDV